MVFFEVYCWRGGDDQRNAVNQEVSRGGVERTGKVQYPNGGNDGVNTFH